MPADAWDPRGPLAAWQAGGKEAQSCSGGLYVVVVTGNSRDQTRPGGGSGQGEVLRELRGQGVRRISERPEKRDYIICRKHVLAN